MLYIFCNLALSAIAAALSPRYDTRAFASVAKKRHISGNVHSNPPDDLSVDLGYERYQGVSNTSTHLNTWLGIRYAAAPTGKLRWQPPQAPVTNRSQVLAANALPLRCPQSPPAGSYTPDFDFAGNEDCLFLSVYCPQNKTNLPVYVWIHGGGYGEGQGNLDPSPIINTNNDNFVGVIIQYRLGAFGFMSSDEVMRYGAVNAGLLDQTFALQWVQSYINLFGGDASRVTVGGESAGGGSVMLQSLAFGGCLGDSLFSNVIAASPYLPQQWRYNDFVPSQSYYAFASAAGCFGPSALPQNNANSSIFKCLVAKDTKTLQNASAAISGSSRYGTWAFLPVTDDVYIQQLPSQQLLQKRVNGARLLVGNNANEGVAFVPQDIVTEDDFVNYLYDAFPLFTEDDVSKVLLYYPSPDDSLGSSMPSFATNGRSPPTALNQSTFATGQQQRAINVYAETTFVCPSYWMAEAFTDHKRVSYKYQYSVIGAEHASDVFPFFGLPTPNHSKDFVKAIMRIWGNFITKNNPSISPSIANGANSSSKTNPASDFPAFSIAHPYQLNLNQSGGLPFSAMPLTLGPNITEFEEPGLKNDFSRVNAYTWEGGRGTRCDFWRSIGSIVPE